MVCVARAVLELRLALNIEIHLLLPPRSGIKARATTTRPKMGFSLSSELLYIIRLFVNYIQDRTQISRI